MTSPPDGAELPASADPTPEPTPTAADRIAATLPPFGASIAGALALLPDASLPVAAAADAYTRAVVRPVTLADAERWLAESTAHVVVKLDGWGRLSQRTPVEGGLSDRAALALRARALVHDHTAHVIEATRGRGDGDTLTGYADLLLRRYTEGLDELVGWLPGRLATGDPSDPGAGDVLASELEGLPAARFGAPAFTRHTGF